ncbi:MAG: DUF1150 family protein [Pseudomonadota bacterium]
MTEKPIKAEATEIQIVYVRQVRHDEMPADAPDTPLFAIHDEMGNRIGLAPKRDLAFIAARQHELMPVSVH